MRIIFLKCSRLVFNENFISVNVNFRGVPTFLLRKNSHAEYRNNTLGKESVSIESRVDDGSEESSEEGLVTNIVVATKKPIICM